MIARQSPLRWHTPSMSVGEGLAQNTETETRHQEDVDIGSAQNKGQLRSIKTPFYLGRCL